jgi:tetratricopeptide (TPR) repeat protein
VLIVLDDAVSAEQIRPLVPGTPGAAMILTTRARLTTIPGAERIELRQLGPTESVVLLRRVIGDTRVAAEPEAAGTLARLCSGLPLALRIAGARLAARPHWPISRLVERMSDERRRLDEMTADGLAVRMSVAVSYEGLAPAARRMFRLLGFLAVSEFIDWQAASLAAVPVDEAEELLEQLVDARLLDVVEDLKQHTLLYRMHDLVRLFAHERAGVEDADDELRTAVERVVGTAIELVDRRRERLPYATPRLYRRALATPAADASILAADSRLPRWTPGEVACLVAVVERASALDMDDAACVLADALVFASFALANDFVGWNRAHTAALRAARISGNRGAEAVIESEIALLRYKEDRFAEAQQHFAAAMTLFEFAGDEQGAATARSGLGTVLRELGRHRAAEPLLEQALQTFSRINDPAGAAHAAYGLGFANRELGNDDAAVRYLEQAVSLYRSLNNWRGEAIAIRGVGLVHRARGELELAARWCGQAHDLLVERGDRRLSCYTAQSLAKVWIRQGDVERAREPLEGSLAICREQHDRFGVALMLRTVGEMHLAAGRTEPALQQLAAAHAAWKELDHDLGKARTLRDIGATHAQAGDCEAAHVAWRTAWATFSDLGTREAAELQAWRQQWGCGCDGVLVEALQPSGKARDTFSGD